MKKISAKTVIILSDKNAKGSLSFTGSLFEKAQIANDSDLQDKELQLLKLLRTLATDGVCYQVDQNELARLLETSQPTISRRMKVLRIKRWVTLLQSIAQADGKNARHSYRVHQNALSVIEAMQNDEQYLVFLHENTGSGGRIRKLSLSELAQIDDNLLLSHNVYLTETEVDDETLTPLSKDADKDELLNNTETSSQLDEDTKELFTDKNQLFTNELQENTEENSYSHEKNSYSRVNSTNKTAIQCNSQQFTSGNQLFTPELQKNESDIYNTARVHTPPRVDESPTGIYKTTTSGCRDESEKNAQAVKPIPIAETQAVGGGCGDDKFSFFESSPIIREIVFDLKAHPKFGNKACHAIINCLKAGKYETKNGETFSWQPSEETACELMIALLNKSPNYPVLYLRKLILLDNNGEFIISPEQRKLLTEVHRRINPNYQPDSTDKPRTLSPVQQLFDWQLPDNRVKEFQPQHLEIGGKVEALTDIAFWDANKGDKAIIEQYKWNTERFEDSLYLRFNGLMYTISYEQICKGLELGVIRLCD